MSRTAKRFGCFLLVLTLLMSCFSAFASSANTATVIQAYQVPGQEQDILNLSFRLTNHNNVPVVVADGLAFSLNGQNVTFQQYKGGGAIGHVMVLDLSEYYYQYLDMKEMVKMASSMLNGIPQGERVLLITIDGDNVINKYLAPDGSWMTTAQAYQKIKDFVQTKGKKGVNLYAAIEEAVKTATTISPMENSKTPTFISSVLVITGGLVRGGSAHKESIKQRLNNRKLSLIVAWPNREAYLRNDSNSNATAVKNGMQEMDALLSSVGGVLHGVSYVAQSGQRGDFQDISRLQDLVTFNLKGNHYFMLRASSLVGKVAYQQNDKLDLQISGSASGFVGDIPFDTSRIARPTATPKPATPSPSPTKQPTPTPKSFVVALGDSHKEARQVLIRLAELHYLQEDTKDIFNEAARSALYKLLDRNNRPDAEGVTKETYDFIMYGEPIPYPTPTPPPATPTPTPPPMELDYGLTDEQMGMGQNGYIKQMQEVLAKLNCFGYYGEKYIPGVFGDSTVKAVALFSEHYGIINTKPNGVSLELLQIILDSGNRTPVSPSPAPTDTPAPTPEPFRDLAINETDLGNSRRWIRQLQEKLKSLGFFDILPGEQKFTLGTLDAVTLNGVAAYASREGIQADLDSGISAELLESILAIDETKYQKVEPTPSPTPPGFIDNARERLVQTINIAEIEVPIWVIALVSLVLLVGIIVVMALLRSGRKVEDSSISSASSRPVPPPVPHGEGDGLTEADNGQNQQDFQMPLTDEDRTVAGGSGLPVSITITFGGTSRTEYATISDSFIIGRKMCNLILDNSDKGVSRKHAKLFSRDGNLFIQDLGSVNGTFADGVQVPANNAAQDREDMTIPLDVFNAAQNFSLSNGATLRMGNHVLTVNW